MLNGFSRANEEVDAASAEGADDVDEDCAEDVNVDPVRRLSRCRTASAICWVFPVLAKASRYRSNASFEATIFDCAP